MTLCLFLVCIPSCQHDPFYLMRWHFPINLHGSQWVFVASWSIWYWHNRWHPIYLFSKYHALMEHVKVCMKATHNCLRMLCACSSKWCYKSLSYTCAYMCTCALSHVLYESARVVYTCTCPSCSVVTGIDLSVVMWLGLCPGASGVVPTCSWSRCQLV